MGDPGNGKAGRRRPGRPLAAGDRFAGQGRDVGDAGQGHQDVRFLGEQLDGAAHAPLAGGGQAVGGEAADNDGRGAQGQREEDVGARADAAVESQVQGGATRAAKVDATFGEPSLVTLPLQITGSRTLRGKARHRSGSFRW